MLERDVMQPWGSEPICHERLARFAKSFEAILLERLSWVWGWSGGGSGLTVKAVIVADGVWIEQSCKHNLHKLTSERPVNTTKYILIVLMKAQTWCGLM